MILLKLPEEEHVLQKKTVTPPLGLWSMRTNSEEVVEVIDAHLLGWNLSVQLIEDLKTDHKTLGISAQFSTQKKILETAIEYFKRSFQIVVGGQYGSLRSFPDVLTWQGWGEKLVNDKIHHIDDVKLPEFERGELEPYWNLASPHGLKSKTQRWMSIETSRGCSNDCSFCGMRDFFGRWQGRSVWDLDEYLFYLSQQRGIEELFIEDDNISWIGSRFEDILGLFETYHLSWSAPNGIYARSLLGNPRMSKNLKQSGCWSLSIPFETANKETARKMHLGTKFLSREESFELVKSLKGEGIEVNGFFIIGYPGEDSSDVKRTLELANSLPLDGRFIYFATPYEGTELYELCKKNNWLLEGTPSYRNPIIETPWLKRDELVRLFEEDREKAKRRNEA